MVEQFERKEDQFEPIIFKCTVSWRSVVAWLGRLAWGQRVPGSAPG
jgi:hypothetical protein